MDLDVLDEETIRPGCNGWAKRKSKWKWKAIILEFSNSEKTEVVGQDLRHLRIHQLDGLFGWRQDLTDLGTQFLQREHRSILLPKWGRNLVHFTCMYKFLHLASNSSSQFINFRTRSRANFLKSSIKASKFFFMWYYEIPKEIYCH